MAMKARPERCLVGVSEAARRLKLSENTVRRFANQGLIPCTRDTSNKRLFDPDVLDRIKSERAR